ncbi:MAG: hypothetical protein AB7J32_18635, partial [Pseudonocardia sp.]
MGRKRPGDLPGHVRRAGPWSVAEGGKQWAHRAAGIELVCDRDPLERHVLRGETSELATLGVRHHGAAAARVRIVFRGGDDPGAIAVEHEQRLVAPR